MKILGTVFLSALGLPLVASGAAITEVSITRAITADAQAGGPPNVETISSSASGWFDQKRTDADSSADAEAEATAFQRTLLSVTDTTLGFGGSSYLWNKVDGALITTNSQSSMDIYFTTDDRFYVRSQGRFISDHGADRTEGVDGGVFRVTSDGEQLVMPVFAEPQNPHSLVLGAGRYHFKMQFSLGKETTEIFPEREDVTRALTDISFQVYPYEVPEACATGLLLIAGGLMIQRRRRRP